MGGLAEPATERPPAWAPRHLLDGLVAAFTFLTIIPLRVRRESDPVSGAVWFPAVGAAAGALPALVLYGCSSFLGEGPAAVMAVALSAIVTGGLHQDGLADCADALGVHGDRGRRLEAMRDSRIGTFGALAVGLWLLLMARSVEGIGPHHAAALVTAGALARWAALLHAILVPPARADGLGASFSVTGPVFVCASALALALGVAASGPVAVAVSWAAVGLVTVGVSALATRAFGGRSGDTLGAAAALAEVVACVVLLALVR